MSAYILSICGAVILSALVTIIMPEGKIGKFINGVLKILCVFIMLVPLVNWVSDLKFEGKGEGNETEVSLDEDYLDYFFGKQAESFSEELEKIVEKEFSIKVLIVTDWECADYAFSVRKVQINIKDFGMNGNDEHIMIIEQLRTRVSEIANIDKEAVTVYEGTGNEERTAG